MKHKLSKYLFLPAAILVLLGTGTAAYAHGLFGLGQSLTPQQQAQNMTERFQQQANLLGLSVDDVKTAWAKGETIQQLAQEHNITLEQLQQKMQDQRKQQIQENLNTLVSQGVITQAQADSRLQIENQRQNSGFMGRRGHGGGMGMMGF